MKVVLLLAVVVTCVSSTLLFIAAASSSSNFMQKQDGFLQFTMHPHPVGIPSTNNVTDRRHSSRHEQQLEAAASERAYMSNYQSVPLLQGYGTQHYVTAWIGSPFAQRQTLIVDTGSPFTAFPCRGCLDCGEHTDPHFDPTSSATVQVLSNCSDCILGASCVSLTDLETNVVAEQCEIRQSYSDDLSSSWTAYQATDSFSLGVLSVLGNTTTATTTLPFAVPFTFHCQMTQTGLFATQLADGILGMAAHQKTLVPLMVKQNKLLHNMFSLCFHYEPTVSKESGVMTLGGVDERLHDSPMVYAKRIKKEDYGTGSATNSWYYAVHVKNIFLMEGSTTEEEYEASFMLPQSKIKNKHIHPISQHPVLELRHMNSGKGVILDSGTTDTYLGADLKKPFEDLWKEIMSSSSSSGLTDYHNDEIKLTKRDVISLPSILIQLQAFDSKTTVIGDPNLIPGLTGSIDSTSPADIIFVIPPTHYLEYSPSQDTYTSRLYFTESVGGVLGVNSMQGHDVLFDWENERVGFAKSSCSYRELEESNNEELSQVLANGGADEGDVVVDCMLGAPSISITCVDSVEEDINIYCINNKKRDHKLHGYEQWLRVIETDASAAGKSCVEISNSLIDESGATVECNDGGFCIETRPCSLSCSSSAVENYLKFADTQPKDNNSEETAQSLLPCGDNLFGACQPKCTQSKIATVVMEDGQCHATGKAVTRPCHIDDCGRDNPCVVPYVIHCIFGFAGNRLFWDKAHEEVFASALARAICETAGCDDIKLGPGDVKVLIASRWSDSDPLDVKDSGSGEDLGLKVVAEVSVFNFASSPENVLSVSCRDEDFVEFSELAELIHSALQEESFLTTLLSLTENVEQGTPTNSSFKGVDGQRSKLLTSWIIKTEVDKSDQLRESGYGEENKLWNRLSDPGFLTAGFAIFLFIVTVGIYCWHEMEHHQSGRQHYSNLRSRLRARNGDRGTYSQIAADEVDDDCIVGVDELDEKECEGDIEFA